MLSINMPGDIAALLAKRLRQCRLDHNWSREELSQRSGVTVASIRRFESKGEISLTRLLQLCFTLHALDGFENVLLTAEPTSIAEIEKDLRKKVRKRARRRSS